MDKINKSLILLFLLLSALISCKSQNVKKRELLGLWKNDKSGSLLVKNDGTCEINDLPSTLFSWFDEKVPEFLDAHGTWETTQDNKMRIYFRQISGIKTAQIFELWLTEKTERSVWFLNMVIRI